jgi:hypothetical protein
VKIYVAAVETLRKKERGQDGTQVGTKNGAFLSSTPRPLKANVHLCRVFLNLTRFWTKLRVLVLCFSDFTENSNIALTSKD